MSYPVVLVVYNRPKHTAKVLNVLRERRIEPLYIFADGPKPKQSGKMRMRVDAVRILINSVIDWTEPHIEEQATNRGLRWSIVNAVDTVLSKHEAFILLEDDCVPGEHFFRFMNKGLRKYAGDKKIMGITGHTPEIPKHIRDAHPWDCYFFPRIGSQGWGTWRRAWKHYKRDFKSAYKKAKKKNIDLNQGGTNLPPILEAVIKGKIDAWTPGWVLATFLRGGQYVYPIMSHIQNIGWDGSGVNSQRSSAHFTPLATKKPKRFPSGIVDNPEISAVLRRYFR